MSSSDAYAEIEYITYLTISFKIVPISGEGYVILKHPEKFPFIFSPVSEADCFFKCLEEAGLRFDDTIHNIKHKEKIPSYVSSRLISRVLSHLTTKIQIILHNERNGFFQVKTHDCTRIPVKVNAGCILIHIGHVYGHYFLIKDKTLLHTLSASDFERFEDKNEELALKIDTLREPKYFVRKVGNTICIGMKIWHKIMDTYYRINDRTELDTTLSA